MLWWGRQSHAHGMLRLRIPQQWVEVLHKKMLTAILILYSQVSRTPTHFFTSWLNTPHSHLCGPQFNFLSFNATGMKQLIKPFNFPSSRDGWHLKEGPTPLPPISPQPLTLLPFIPLLSLPCNLSSICFVTRSMWKCAPTHKWHKRSVVGCVTLRSSLCST